MGQMERQAENKKAPRKGKFTTPDAPAQWSGFVDVEMDASDKANFLSVVPPYEDVWEEVEVSVQEAYKFSLSYSEKYTTWNASLTCTLNGHVNAGLTLSGRGGTPHRAMSALWYKHVIMLERDWSKRPANNGRQMGLDGFG